MSIEEKTQQNITDIAVLDTKVKGLDEKIDTVDSKVEKIMTNHLPHIQRELVKVRITIAWASGAVVGAITLIETIMKFIQ